MLNRDYREMLLCFARYEVDYIVVGAYALAAHGFPRSTADIDIWVRPDEINSQQVYSALVEFGAPLQDIDVQTFALANVVYQIGVAPCRIDILTGISGDVTFDEAMGSSKIYTLDDLEVRVLGVEMLIRNKLATGRPRDLADVAMLRKRGSSPGE